MSRSFINQLIKNRKIELFESCPHGNTVNGISLGTIDSLPSWIKTITPVTTTPIDDDKDKYETIWSFQILSEVENVENNERFWDTSKQQVDFCIWTGLGEDEINFVGFRELHLYIKVFENS